MSKKKEVEKTELNVRNVDGKFLEVKPSKEGNKLTNGETISECLYTPIHADLSVWKEITPQEADALQADLDAKADACIEE